MSEHMMPIPSRVYNAAVGGHVCGPEDIDFGQKVVHLIKYDRSGNEVSFESQVTQANKIYVIHDDFVLSNNVTIPANCVLEFDGGSISGDGTNKNTIVGQATTINAEKVTILNSVILSGSWKNKELFVSWFGLKTGTDYSATNTVALNSYVIPSCANTALSLCVDVAIHINDSFTVTDFDLICQCRIYYTGVQTLDGAVVDIENSRLRNHTIDIENLSTDGTYDTRKDYTIEGVRINNISNSNVHIEFVRGFTTGVCIMSSVGSYGNFNNNYYLNYINDSYKNLVIKRTNGGWVNDNLFIGGRLQNDSDDVFFGHNTAISFINGNQESNVSFNNNIFVKPDIEYAYIGIYAGTKVMVEDSKFISVRDEDVISLIVDEGDYREFANKSIVSTYREYNKQGRVYKTFRVEGYVKQMREYHISLQGISTGNRISCYKGTHLGYKGASGEEGLMVMNDIGGSALIDAKYINLNDDYGVGYLFIKTEDFISALVDVFGKVGQDVGCFVWLLDDDLHITNTDGLVTNAHKNSDGAFYISSFTIPSIGFVSFYFQMNNIPSNVKYVAIVPVGVTCGSHLYLDNTHELVQFDNELIGDKTSVLFGMTDDVEYNYQKVVSCVNKTSGKPIWRINGVWVDATGTPV